MTACAATTTFEGQTLPCVRPQMLLVHSRHVWRGKWDGENYVRVTWTAVLSRDEEWATEPVSV